MNKKVYFLEELSDPIELYMLAIHSPLKDYQLAYRLNQHFGARFKRTRKDIDNPFQKTFYSRFVWKHEKYGWQCDFFANKDIHQTAPSSNNALLFDLPSVNAVSLITEFKQVDFFIQSEEKNIIDEFARNLKTMEGISMSYVVLTEKIKDQLNLIFD